MKKKLAFLHTLAANIAVFDRSVRECGYDVEVAHRVNESVLKETMKLGRVDESIADRIRAEISELRDDGADVVVCTCSSIGAIAEEMNKTETIEVQRIDRAMADKAVGIGERIVLATSLSSTLGPTRELLESSARRLGKSISIKEIVISSAWARYVAGDMIGYLDEVAKAMTAQFEEGDAIVLAQASMADAALLVSDSPIPILSSPKLGVQRAVEAVTC
jgi:hypothetical protein|tara:strand:+ start:148 stop:804 length:657 start_codon:yes stop_codon:yes gene_type:complete